VINYQEIAKRLEQQLAAKDAEIERLMRERDYWQNSRALPAEAELATAERQRDTLKEALEPFAEHAKTVDSECVEDPDDTIICGFNGNYLRIGDIRRAQAALAFLDQPANAAEGEKRD
jgi:hypothetical protein